MKIEKVFVNFSAEKLQAIKILSPQVYDSIENVLSEQLEKLYVKAVPLSTRKYIEAKLEEESQPQQKGGTR